MSGKGGAKKAVKSVLIGAGAALGLTGLGMDTSVSLSTYGLYLGAYGPYFVIAGLPIFLNVVFALALTKSDQRAMRYSMIGTAVVVSLVVGYMVYVGVFQVLIPGS